MLRRNAKLIVSPTKRILKPGEKLSIKIFLEPREEFIISRVLGRFMGEEQIFLSTNKKMKTLKNVFLSSTRELDFDVTVNRLKKYEWLFEFSLPNDLPPSYNGESVKIRYLFEAKVEIKHALPTVEVVPLTILQKIGEIEELHLEKEYQIFKLGLVVPSTIPAGHDLKGELYITPNRDFTAEEIRFDLICREETIWGVFLKQTRTLIKTLMKFKIIGKKVFHEGIKYNLPLSIKLPSNLATFETSRSKVRYIGKVAIRCEGRDFFLEFPLRILRVY